MPDIHQMIVEYVALCGHLGEQSRTADGGVCCCVCGCTDNLRSQGPGVLACADCVAGEPAEWVSESLGRGMPREWHARPLTDRQSGAS